MPTKRKSVAIKAHYPDGLDKASYIKGLIAKYRGKYDPDHIYFSDNQMSIPINDIVSLIAFAIESTNEIDTKEIRCAVMKKFVMTPEFKLEESSVDYYHYKLLYFYQQGKKGPPSVILKRKKDLFPDSNEEAYLDFTKEVAREAILGITNATIDFINVVHQKENVIVEPAADLQPRKKKKVNFSFNFFSEAEKEEKNERVLRSNKWSLGRQHSNGNDSE